MKTDRGELEKKLISVIDEVKHRNKLMAQITDRLAQFGVVHGTLEDIARGSKKLSDVGVDLLCLVTRAVYEVLSPPELNYRLHFTDKEIEAAERYQSDIISSRIELPFTFENIIMINDQNYIGKISVKKLVSLYHSGLIIYDFDSQRSPKYEKFRDSVILVPDVNPRSIREISGRMVSGDYYPDTIRLNAYSETEVALTYDDNKKELTVHTEVTALDGFHRLQSMVRALTLLPDMDLEMELSIKSYDPENQRRYFGQINTINPLNEARLKELKQERSADSIVKELQTRTSSDLRRRITPSTTTNTSVGHLTSSIILSDAIDDFFKGIKSTLEEREITDYLTEFFNHLIGLFPDEFITKQDTYRKISLINDPMMFYGYVALAKRMRDDNIELMKLKEIIRDIDFSKEGAELGKMFSEGIKETRRNKIKLANFFENVSLRGGNS